MLTLITGTPGAGKSLYTVWEIARKIPGSTLEVDGEAKPRRIFSNIKNLLIDHELMDSAMLDTWHDWAKPGDVIIYDEVQEVWRPRTASAKVPPAIAALETHRHKGVDIVLVTQHPNLLDSNIRRLINQHLHLRRITSGLAMVYEWDACSNVTSVKTAIQSRLWRHPKAAYRLYKSAQAHTKPTQRLPRVLWFGVAAALATVVMVPNLLGRFQDRFNGGGVALSKPATVDVPKLAGTATVLDAPGSKLTKAPIEPEPLRASSAFVPQAPVLAGCAVAADRCGCFDAKGESFPMDKAQCLDHAGANRGPAYDLGPDTPSPAFAVAAGDYDTLRWMASQRGK